MENYTIPEPQPIVDPMDAATDDTYDVELPDGTLIQGIPTGTTREQIRAKFEPLGYNFEVPDNSTPGLSGVPEVIAPSQENPTDSLLLNPQEDKGFSDRMSEDWQKRQENIRKNDLRNFAGGQSNVATALTTLGQGLGIVGDTGANLAGSAGRYIRDLVPEPIDRGVTQALKDTGKALADTKVGRAAGELAQEGEELAEKHPTTAGLLAAAGNLAAIAPVGAGTKLAAEGTGSVLSKAGKGLAEMGETQAINRQADFVKDLVMPKETKKVLEDQVGRTTEKGLLKSKVVEPTALEQAVIDQVVQIPGVKKSKTFQANYNIIDHAKNKEAEDLVTALKASKVKFEPTQVEGKFNEVLDTLKQDPMIVGDAETTATRVVNKMQELIKQNPKTPAGLLKARQQFDSWAKSKKGTVFDANQTAFSSAVMNTRQATNNFIAEIVPDAGVKESLRKQSLLYHALDNIEAKAASEGKNRLSRLAKAGSDAIPIKNPILKGAAQVGALGGLGGAATLAPTLTAGALGLYGVGRAASSPITKKVIGRTLEKTGDVLRGGRKKAVDSALKGNKVAKTKADPLALPYYPEEQELIAGWGAAPRPMTAVERQAAKASRERASNLGLTPDVRRVQNRNLRNADFEKAELDKLKAEQATLEEKINMARYNALGKVDSPILDALGEALTKKKRR